MKLQFDWMKMYNFILMFPFRRCGRERKKEQEKEQ